MNYPGDSTTANEFPWRQYNSSWITLATVQQLMNYPGDSTKKSKALYGQEPTSGESTTTECGVNYQILAVITEVAQWGTPSCSRPQPATDIGARDGRSNWLIAPPPPSWAVPPELHVWGWGAQGTQQGTQQPVNYPDDSTIAREFIHGILFRRVLENTHDFSY